ncbi:MAG: N-acetyl-1-D-myo-inositol-2-amino-2-deoxy-alpha-D-glucopyranoside deacetylase [Nocardioidaceae bacterium]
MEHRLLLVHAHPDDETIQTGATMAKYAAEGAHVTLVTCTLGEEGEIVVPELAHLAPDREDRLGEYRIGELDEACRALGVSDHRYLGGPGRYRDSGMMGEPSNDHPRCFWRADLHEAARLLVEVVREVRPQVIVSYDANGFYGHPDHIQAHRVARRAFEKAGDPSYAPGEPWRPDKFYETAVPRSWLRRAVEEMKGEDSPFGSVESVDELPFGTPDEAVTTEIDARDHHGAKMDALRAHRTQVRTDEGPFFALSNDIGQQAFGREHYVLVAGPRGPGERETDLFAGLS